MKRWLLRICAFLILGAIVNVAVAWGFAFLINLEDLGTASRARGTTDSGAGYWFVTRVSTTGALQVRSLWPNTGSPSMPVRPTDEIAGSWVRVLRSPANDGKSVTVDVRGWPELSLYSVAHRHDVWNTATRRADLRYDINGGIAMRDWPMPTGFGGIRNLRVLPLLPHWPGFARNTFFYAAILFGGWLLLVTPLALRRIMRSRRGLCPRCAYPVGTSDVCTECGAAVTRQRG